MVRPLLLSVSLLALVMTACEEAQTPTAASRQFSDSFNRRETLEEAGSMEESADADWWLNSGAYLYYNGNTAATIQGELPDKDPWRLRYFKSNPTETDNGYHPQNIFRLITRSKWQSYVQQAYYKINRYILSPDPRRQPSNGLLLFNHYQDGNNLYYTGLRVDGFAVIKKKIGGTYFTIATRQVLPGKYDRERTPNLIPTDTWIGIRSIVSTGADRAVHIQVFSDIGRTGQWALMLETEDNSQRYGGDPISQSGYAGIRIDFMDVEFSDYSIVER